MYQFQYEAVRLTWKTIYVYIANIVLTILPPTVAFQA